MRARAWFSWAARRTGNPIRLAAVTGMLLMPMAYRVVSLDTELPQLLIVPFTVFVLGAGLLGLDRSSGMIGVIMSRPLRRSTYVLGRWAGLTMLGWIVFAIQAIVGLSLSGALAPDPLPPLDEIATWAWLCAISIAASAALLTLASTLFAGIADACAVMAGTTLVSLALHFATRLDLPEWFGGVAEQLHLFAEPGLNQMLPSARVLDVACNAAISLTLAVLVMNRREIHSREEI